MSRPKIVAVDVGAATDPSQLQELLAVGFHFPDWSGRNWNAFSDCITCLDPMPQKIVVRGLAVLATRLPFEAGQLSEILENFRSATDLSHVELIIE